MKSQVLSDVAFMKSQVSSDVAFMKSHDPQVSSDAAFLKSNVPNWQTSRLVKIQESIVDSLFNVTDKVCHCLSQYYAMLPEEMIKTNAINGTWCWQHPLLKLTNLHHRGWLKCSSSKAMDNVHILPDKVAFTQVSTSLSLMNLPRR